MFKVQSSKLIEIEHLSAGYDGKQVLHDINLTVYQDDYLGIIGPNGGGKTTLMRLILGLMKPTEGRIRYYKDGQEVKEIRMGYLPQYNSLDKQFPISVYEVVLSGLSKTKSLFSRYTQAQHQQVLDCLERMQLMEFKDRHIAALSGGQLQRVLLARAIVSKPDVVILDEPNTYIDRRFQKQMYEMLEQINKECAIIIVSHDIAECCGGRDFDKTSYQGGEHLVQRCPDGGAPAPGGTRFGQGVIEILSGRAVGFH